ncbi:MAG: glycoside hydrolase family 2 protein [Tannerellaceae bacterium]|nr:glycoside hydrolase family 2 protein [Tannerellaceae bacterium]
MRKKAIYYLLWLLVVCSHSVVANPVSIELHNGWKFRQGRMPNWYSATVPGVIHTDLLDNKIIEDPFFRLNERGLQWIDKEDWMYETHFDVPAEIFNKENIRLVFKGLDTYADVYLNHEKILEANNMFREWTIDLKEKLKEKDNKLEVYFHSPIKVDIPKWDALPYQYRTGPDQAENGGIFNKRVSIFARKAGYHYGWDWGPRLVTSGIWRPVVLEGWDDVKIEDVYIRQKEVSAAKAVICTEVEVLADKDINGATVSVKDNQTNKLYGSVKTNLKKGLNKVQVNFTIQKPRLWWSNGLGEPHLYEFTTEINAGNETVKQVNRTGIRSIKVHREPDKYGTNFYFELNGVPVFAKGANYIPSDNFLPRVTDEKYKQTILDAVNANMNMLRVWGGGIYENDIFYDLCDEYGIMVWQDFMFACSLYPAEGEFLENIRQEVIQNVKRLRNHPSISIWCGNNEVHEFWIAWGYRETYSEVDPEYERIVWKQYTDLFDGVLPETVQEYSPGMFYLSSSPYSTGPDDEVNGDRHYWRVWHGQHPTDQFNIERSRFFSEYGFQSFPEFESVKKFAPVPDDWNITSEVMLSHQRAGTYGNQLMRDYLEKEHQTPKDFEHFLYMSQVLQGDAVKKAMEAHRRDMPFCMGTLFWQHNDCWPVASWASRDYYGRWKAQHYFAREAYKEVLVSPAMKEDQLNIYVVSDRLTASSGKLCVRLITFDGKTVSEQTKQVRIPANNSQIVFTEEVDKLIQGYGREKVFLQVTLTDKKGTAYKNTFFLTLQKDIDFPPTHIKRTIRPVEGGYEIALQSDRFARAVFLSVDSIDNWIDNNYFDILPGETVKTVIKTPLSQTELERQLKIISIRDAY